MHQIGKAENPDDKKPVQNNQRRPWDLMRDFRPTGCKAIDRVALCVMWHQERHIALRAIYLKEQYYDWFRLGTELLLGRSLEDGEYMDFYGIHIEKGDRRQKDPILAERWRDDIPDPRLTGYI